MTSRLHAEGVLLGNGRGFDVAKARAYCEGMITESDRLDQEREVFADWTRDRGMGPENYVHVAMRSCELCQDCRMVRRVRSGTAPVRIEPVGPWTGPVAHIGGWPGNLAHEYTAERRARRFCTREVCVGGALPGSLMSALDNAARASQIYGGSSLTLIAHGDGVAVACPDCQAFDAERPSRAFVNGGNMRAAAQRLLDTLDGRCPWNADAMAQPSECSACNGRGVVPTFTPAVSGEVVSLQIPTNTRTCLACNGTGHNLRGVLPPLPAETARRLQQRIAAIDPRNVQIRIAGVEVAPPADGVFVGATREEP